MRSNNNCCIPTWQKHIALADTSRPSQCISFHTLCPPANLTWNLFSGLRIWTYRGQFGAKSFTAQARRMVWWSWENWRRSGVGWSENKGERETEREKKMHRVRKRGRNPSLALSDCSSSVIILLTHWLHSTIEWSLQHFRSNAILTSLYREVSNLWHEVWSE